MKNKFFDPSLFNQPWLMGKSDLDALIHFARNTDPDQMAAWAAGSGRDKTPPPYTVKNGLAVITVRGMLFKESYYFSYGPPVIRTFSELVQAADRADADPAVKKKLLKIDCPGSTVAGCFEAMSALKKSAKVKPFYTFVDSNMKSGGYLVGSIGTKIAATKSAEIGSIGVRTTHINESALNEKMGIEVTHLAAGKYKLMGNPDGPLGEDAKEYFQDRLDTTYTLFVDAVAENRSMRVKDVLKAADGREFLGAAAKENGLIDLIVDDLDSFISIITKEDTSMDLKEFKTNHPALFSQIEGDAMAAGRAEVEETTENRVTDAKTGAQAAVIGIISALAGQEMADKVQKLVDSGLTVDQLSAVQGIFVPEGGTPPDGEENQDLAAGTSRQDILGALQKSGNKPLTGGNQPPGGSEPDFMADVTAYMEEKGGTKAAAMKAIRAKDPDKYEAWLAKQQ